MSNEEDFNLAGKTYYKLTPKELIPFVPSCIFHGDSSASVLMINTQGNEVSMGLLGVDVFDSIDAAILFLKKCKTKKTKEINSLSKRIEHLLKLKGGVQ